MGYNPEMILAGRRINDNMGIYVAAHFVRLMVKKSICMPAARILVMGLTFKENCPDVRNTRVVDVVAELEGYGSKVDIFDPWADAHEVAAEYGLKILQELPEPGLYDGIIITVAHREFRELSVERIRALGKKNSVIYDIKNVLPADAVDGRL